MVQILHLLRRRNHFTVAIRRKPMELGAAHWHVGATAMTAD